MVKQEEAQGRQFFPRVIGLLVDGVSVCPDNNQVTGRIPSGFSRWSFSFGLRREWIAQRYHQALADGVSVSAYEEDGLAKDTIRL